ncbi:hypothetical protein [Brevundimonas sp. M20]|uniref:hypothetical protein n=1 Tax=Brevundimonas sp. M20 TaxID=2591463 RepID=UPI0011475376|nr:hypothetical protein [Brevundimonas sp. M20]QDH72743.1 hypothetical protein FKQ52_04410 [Brevundimonas sp. M20]
MIQVHQEGARFIRRSKDHRIAVSPRPQLLPKSNCAAAINMMRGVETGALAGYSSRWPGGNAEPGRQ